LGDAAKKGGGRLLMKAANVGARAAWALGRWGEMEHFARAMEDGDASKPFYRAVLALRPGAEAADLDAAASLVDDARRLATPALAALVSESYARAYGTLVAVQQLSELEEVIELRRAERAAAREARQGGDARTRREAALLLKGRLIDTWRRRLAGCSPDAATWQRVLNVRALALRYDDDPDSWLRYASLCRKSGNARLSESVLTRQLGFDPASAAIPEAPLADHRLRSGRRAESPARVGGVRPI